MSPRRNALQRDLGAADDTRPTCDYCQTRYTPTRAKQRFCSPKCRQSSWEQSHPRVDIGAVKLEGKPTAAHLEASGIPVRRGGRR